MMRDLKRNIFVSLTFCASMAEMMFLNKQKVASTQLLSCLISFSFSANWELRNPH